MVEQLAEVKATASELFGRRLDVSIRAQCKLIAVITPEEERFIERLLAFTAASRIHKNKDVWQWSVVSGLQQLAGTPTLTPPPQGSADPVTALKYIGQQTAGIFVMCDLAPHLAANGGEDPQTIRLLKETARKLEKTAASILVIGPSWPRLPSLKDITRVEAMPLPDIRELRAMVDGKIAATRVDREKAQVAKAAGNPDVVIPRVEVDEDIKGRLVASLLGLTQTQAKQALARASVECTGLTACAVPVVMEAKAAVIRESEALSYEEPLPPSAMGGGKGIREAAEEAAYMLSEEYRAQGGKPAKGILLVGLPGTGKDFWARVIASILGKPIIKLEFGKIIGAGGGIIGQADMAIDTAVILAETVGGVLHISEFEKAMGGEGGEHDGGTNKRVIGKFLDWQSSQTTVFVVATANDIRGMRPEQARSGRFDSIVFMDEPTPEDREAIWAVHIRKTGRDPKAYDLASLVVASKGYVGAEIETAVNRGLARALRQGHQPTVADWQGAIRSIRPITQVMADQIGPLRKWAADALAVQASDAAEVTTEPVGPEY